MSTSYIFLAGALFLFVIAIVILFMGKGKKDDKKVDKEFDENYAVNINEVYLRTGDVRETLVQMQDSYEDYNPLMSGLLGKAITYADCISLEKAASIPASVINCDSCYSGCSNLYGELSINTNTEDCANLLSNAVTSGKTLKLKGKSGRLFEIQQDSGSRYVTIKDTEKAEKNAKKLERQNNQ